MSLEPADRLRIIQQRARGDAAPGERRRARVLIADDHGVTRAGLRAVLGSDDDFELIGEASDGKQAVTLTRSLQPDLVLMDVRMPDMDGLTATRIVKATSPLTTVLILSMVEDANLLIEAVKAGAAGYLLKAASESELRSAMRDALDGEFPVDRHLVRDALQQIAHATLAPQPAPKSEVLSAREQQVLALLARGYTNREIAEELIITPSTVKIHVEHILAKLGVSDRTQAAVQGIERGYISRDGGR